MLDSQLLTLLMALGIVAVVFMIFRAIVLWYFCRKTLKPYATEKGVTSYRHNVIRIL
jgi:hypothetical protein